MPKAQQRCLSAGISGPVLRCPTTTRIPGLSSRCVRPARRGGASPGASEAASTLSGLADLSESGSSVVFLHTSARSPSPHFVAAMIQAGPSFGRALRRETGRSFWGRPDLRARDRCQRTRVGLSKWGRGAAGAPLDRDQLPGAGAAGLSPLAALTGALAISFVADAAAAAAAGAPFDAAGTALAGGPESSTAWPLYSCTTKSV